MHLGILHVYMAFEQLLRAAFVAYTINLMFLLEPACDNY